MSKSTYHILLKEFDSCVILCFGNQLLPIWSLKNLNYHCTNMAYPTGNSRVHIEETKGKDPSPWVHGEIPHGIVLLVITTPWRFHEFKKFSWYVLSYYNLWIAMLMALRHVCLQEWDRILIGNWTSSGIFHVMPCFSTYSVSDIHNWYGINPFPLSISIFKAQPYQMVNFNFNVRTTTIVNPIHSP